MLSLVFLGSVSSFNLEQASQILLGYWKSKYCSSYIGVVKAHDIGLVLGTTKVLDLSPNRVNLDIVEIGDITELPVLVQMLVGVDLVQNEAHLWKRGEKLLDLRFSKLW